MLECKPHLHKREDPYWRLSGDGSGLFGGDFYWVYAEMITLQTV